MSQCDTDSGLSVSLDGSHCGISLGPKIEVIVPDLNIKRYISVSMVETIGMLKKLLLSSLSSDLKDSMNFGLFIPSTAGKAGKFLLEERTLTEYGLQQDNSSVELRYKRRLYRSTGINIARLKKLHSKANLKTFIDWVGGGEISRVIKMLNKGLDPNYQLKDTGETPLIRACSQGRPGDMIKALVEGGAHLDFRHSNGHTPLHAAAILGNLEAVQIILDLGQSPNTLDMEGLTPLYHSTISNTAVACAERLLFDYSILGVEDENGLQEIHQACRFGHVQHLELLLQYTADINSQTSKNGNTPLHICAYLNQESCARLLLFRGADRTIINRSGHTPYHQAMLSDNKTLAMLIQYYKDEDVVLLKTVAKYNDKRKSSVAPLPVFQRSRSASGLWDQLDMRQDSGFISQQSSVPAHTRTRTRSIGKLQAITYADNSLKSETSSLAYSKRFSRSFNNLNQKTANGHSVPVEPDQSSNCWAPDWGVDDATDTVSSVSGMLQRKNSRNKMKKGINSKTRSQSCRRRSSKGDLSGLAEIDTRYLPRMVVLQKNSRGFGFIIRGLKASSGFTFVPTSQCPALQYFEEVESGSVAARAGILKGDYILEVNNQSVVAVSHEETVRLIKSSGDILAIKVISINRAPCMPQHRYWDHDMSSMDEHSDISSIISSETRSQHQQSSFTNSVHRSSIPNQFATIGAHPSTTYSSIPHYKSGTNIPSTAYFAPTIPLNDSINSIGDKASKNIIRVPSKRPDSITSIDSLYPMPPPPMNDFHLRESRIEEECIDDRTLKRLKNQVQTLHPPGSAILQQDSYNCMILQLCDSSCITNAVSQTWSAPPPPSGPPTNQNSAPLQPSNTAPPPPCSAPPSPPCSAPPPPPCSAPPPPPPPLPKLHQTPKPILKQPKPLSSNQTPGFDNHLRDAIAKRREKIDNDQCSLASFDSADDTARQHCRSTLNSLKQNKEYSQNQSNRWNNDPPTNKSMFKRTHSDVFSKNSDRVEPKPDDKSSRLYLV